MVQKILTILMPCLNEEETIAFCIREAQLFIQESGIVAEILVVDNGSEDASGQIARDLGARVVAEEKRGYGYAVRAGDVVNVPVIASGGAGGVEDFIHLFHSVPGVDAGLAASIFHFGEVKIPDLKRELAKNNICMRLSL